MLTTPVACYFRYAPKDWPFCAGDTDGMVFLFSLVANFEAQSYKIAANLPRLRPVHNDRPYLEITVSTRARGIAECIRVMLR